MIDVIVVGGGISGLATAYELHRRGVSFVLLEARARAGGVVLSEEVDGFIIDAGPDALLVQKPEAIRLCEELGLGARLISTSLPRLAYIQRGGRLHALPAGSVLGIPTRIGPFLRTSLFSWAGKLRMGAEVFVSRRRDDADESVGSFMRRRFGGEAVDYLAEPLLAGIHAGDVDRLSIRALFPRFVAAEREHGSVLRAFRRKAVESSRSTGARGAPEDRDESPFRSLPRGLSELVDRLIDVLPRTSVRLSTSVVRFSWSHDKEQTIPRVTLASGETLDARAAVFATPAFVTARALSGAAPEIADLCSRIQYTSTATVVFAFDAAAVKHALAGSGFVVPRVESTRILAASWLSSKWPGRAPGGRVLIRTFVGGARDPDALSLTDDELRARSLEALRPLLRVDGVPLFTRVYRWDRANAQHDVGHLEWLRSVEETLASRPGLFVTGSSFRGVGIPDCIADGRATASRVAAWLTATRVGHDMPAARSPLSRAGTDR